jgi:hypothetical protein
MLRVSLCLVVTAFLLGSSLAADQKDTKNNKDRALKATITHVDSKAGTITVKMTDEKGKDVERTFKLREDVRLLDDKGKVVAINAFQVGNDVVVIERDGLLREIHKDKQTKPSTEGESRPGRKKPGEDKPPDTKPIDRKPGEKE